LEFRRVLFRSHRERASANALLQFDWVLFCHCSSASLLRRRFLSQQFRSTIAPRPELAFKFPRLAVRFERLAEPVKGVRSDLGELPARRRPIGARAHLHNVLANSTTN